MTKPRETVKRGGVVITIQRLHLHIFNIRQAQKTLCPWSLLRTEGFPLQRVSL